MIMTSQRFSAQKNMSNLCVWYGDKCDLFSNSMKVYEVSQLDDHKWISNIGTFQNSDELNWTENF